jgi:hypothetical protein
MKFDDSSIEDKINMSKLMVAHGTDKVEKLVDSLSSAGLKRVLKIVSHCHLADALLDRNINFNLSKAEQDVIDSIFALQETVFGHQALIQESENTDNLESSIQTDLTMSLEDNNE